MKDFFKDRVRLAKDKSMISTSCNNNSSFCNKSIINKATTKTSLNMSNSIPV
jgi:hypothetical protein